MIQPVIQLLHNCIHRPGKRRLSQPQKTRTQNGFLNNVSTVWHISVLVSKANLNGFSRISFGFEKEPYDGFLKGNPGIEKAVNPARQVEF